MCGIMCSYVGLWAGLAAGVGLFVILLGSSHAISLLLSPLMYACKCSLPKAPLDGGQPFFMLQILSTERFLTVFG